MKSASQLSPKKYFILLVILPLILLAMLIALTFKSLYLDNIFPEMEWYWNKVHKLSVETNIDTLFIGDSSLEAVIDDKLFSILSQRKTSNMALVGIFGYAGSYNMLKKSLANPNNKIRNVVIVQTLDIMTRPDSYKGYLLSIGSMEDILELSGEERGEVAYAFLNVMLSKKNFMRILKYQLFEEKDEAISLVSIVNSLVDEKKQSDNIFTINDGSYSTQIENKSHQEILKEAELYKNQYQELIKEKYSNFSYERVVEKTPEEIDNPLNPDILFLKKIIALCQKHGINLIYMHGPIWEKVSEISSRHIQSVNSVLSNLSIQFIDQIILIKNEDLFDSYDHVLPIKKHDYTTLYFEAISPKLN